MVARQPTAHRGDSGNAGRSLLLAIVVLLVAGLAGCGARSDRWEIEGHLVAGDGDIWLVDATPIAIGGATVSGERPDPGAAIKAEGRRTPEGVLAAERITVGPVDRSALASRLPAAEVSGPVEALDPATGLWRVGGRTVRVPEGTSDARGVVIGRQVTIRGYTLPNGELLAATVISAELPPARPAPTANPAAPIAPQPAPPRQPTKPEPTKEPEKPDDKDKDDDKGGDDKGKGNKGDD